MASSVRSWSTRNAGTPFCPASEERQALRPAARSGSAGFPPPPGAAEGGPDRPPRGGAPAGEGLLGAGLLPPVLALPLVGLTPLVAAPDHGLPAAHAREPGAAVDPQLLERRLQLFG